MEARTLIIEEKLRTVPPATVRPSDFRLREGGAVDPGIVLRDPNLSLYCLDLERREALFVETPPGTDLSRAPFLYQAQYDAALRLVAVPLGTLHRLAAGAAVDPSRLILIYSVGRCGSTLVSRAFSVVEGVDSLSEPDVFTQMLAAWGVDGLGGAEQQELLRTCTLLQCTPGRLRGATAWALKFRSMVTEMGELFYSVFPEAKVVFLYRHAEPWARSFLRLMGAPDPAARGPMPEDRLRFGRFNARLNGREEVSPLDVLACMWLSVMEKGLEMQARGIPLFVARYEELNAAPRDVLTRMFAHVGLSDRAVGGLDAVLAEDSQAGSAFARAAPGETPVTLSPAHRDELRRLIADYADGLTADSILPGTCFPEGAAS